MLNPHRIQVIIWLWICILMVFGMVILGGAVRLTGSGLSMVDWKPLLGIVPPLNQAGWLEAFDQYKQYPEYQQVNAGMSLTEFKFIFLMEYLHRVLGRLIGIVFFLPFIYFLWRGGLPRRLRSRLWLLFLLGACQGLMGWYMVKSGLVNHPHVSQYRLTAHLMLAVLIFAMMLRLVFDLMLHNIGRSERVETGSDASLSRQGYFTVGLVLLMIATGGFMAGTHAGHIFNTWPMMGGQLIPDMLLPMQPVWRNLFENTITIQFVHRWLAMLVGLAVVWFSFRVWRSSPTVFCRRLAGLAILMVFVQIALGISTLIAGVPITLGVAHQGGALLLLTAVIGAWSQYLPGVGRSPAV